MAPSDEQIQRTSTAKIRKAEAKARTIRVGRGSETADWAGCDPAHLKRTIACVALAGGAIQFGYTRDGGAYSLVVYDSGKVTKLYAGPSGELEPILEAIWEAYEDK